MDPGRRATKILIACALAREAETLRGPLETRAHLLVTGLGKRRTEAKLSTHLREDPPELMIFSGVAGQLDPDLKMGDIVVPAVWKFEDGREFAADSRLVERLRSAGWPLQQIGLTVKRPVLRPKRRRELWLEHSASACDMESAAALSVAATEGIPALAVKVISDTADTKLRDFWCCLDDNLKILAKSLDSLLKTLQS